jgi:hypothetical protein
VHVLFLDFDGVLNSAEFARWWSSTGKPGFVGLDPVLVERLNRVIDATGASVVVSSSWRCCDDTDTPQKLQKVLRDAGYRYNVLDVTPRDFHCDWHDGDCSEGHRGGEINQWFIENKHIIVPKFAIVDDSSDMGPLLPHLVHTTWAKGLQDEHVERLIQALTR